MSVLNDIRLKNHITSTNEVCMARIYQKIYPCNFWPQNAHFFLETANWRKI